MGNSKVLVLAVIAAGNPNKAAMRKPGALSPSSFNGKTNRGRTFRVHFDLATSGHFGVAGHFEVAGHLGMTGHFGVAGRFGKTGHFGMSDHWEWLKCIQWRACLSLNIVM